MFGKTVIAFQSTKGVYKNTIKPYQSWHEVSEVSLALKIDGEYCRLLRTTRCFRRFQPKKIVVCKENGEIEESEEITRKWLKVYIYLRFYKQYKRNLAFDATQGGEKRHVPLIEAFASITVDLRQELSTKEVQAMEFHLYYLKEVYRLSQLIVKEVERLIRCKKQLESLYGEKLSITIVDKTIKHFQTWNKLRHELEAVLLEDGELARDIVLEILKNSHYKKILGSRKYLANIVREMYGAKNASLRTISTVKRRKMIQGEVFSIKAYIEELRNKSLEEEVQSVIDMAIKENWILSPDCIYR